MSSDVHTPRLIAQLLDQRVVDLNAVAAAGVALYDVLRSVPSEVAHLRRARMTWTTFLRFGIRGLASAILILNASQLGFARTQQFCRAYSFFFPIAIEVLVALAIVFFCVHAANFCSVETRTGIIVLYGLTLALLIAQITTFVLALVLHPPKAVDIPGIPGCVYLSTPHDKFSCFWWPALALEMIFVVNAGLHASGSARRLPTLKDGRIVAAQRSRLAEHVVLSVLLLLQSVFGATGKTAASRSTVWWFVTSLSVVAGRMKLDTSAEEDEQRLSAPSPIPASPTSARTIRACGAEPSPSLMGGFVTMPLPAELRNLSPDTGHPRWSSEAPSISSLQSIPSIATTSIEFAARRSNDMSPRNSRVDANYDAGRAYIPFARRTPLPDEWRAPV